MSFIGFGGGMDGGSAQAKQAKQANRTKQRTIDYGLDQINSIFNGGSYPIYSKASSFDPSGSYFTKTNGQYKPWEMPTEVPGMGGGNGGSSLLAQAMSRGTGPQRGGFNWQLNPSGKTPEQIGQNKAGNGKLYTMEQSPTYTGFGDPFFNKRRQDYIDYAMPQLGQQYQAANNALNFGFQNRGLAGSTAAKQGQSNLNLEMGRQQQNIVDTGQSQANALRAQVENSRLQAIQQLYQTADPAQASISALHSASGFTAPNAFQPIANAFSNIANQYAIGQMLQNPYGNDQIQYPTTNSGAIPP